VDREMRLGQLELAKRHIAEGEKHIAAQQAIVAEFRRAGWDVTQAAWLLENFVASQAQHIAHRDRILQELRKTAP